MKNKLKELERFNQKHLDQKAKARAWIDIARKKRTMKELKECLNNIEKVLTEQSK